MTPARSARLARQAWIVLFLLALAALPARAATWTVTGTGEPSALGSEDCSGSTCATLRGAINRAADGDTIVFASALDGATIGLTRFTNCLALDEANGGTCLRPAAGWQGQVEQFGPSAFYLHDRHLTIDASALTQGVVIERDSASRFRLFDVGRAAGLTLRGVTLRHGHAEGGSSRYGGGALGAGGAIFNRGDLVIEHSTLEGNTAKGGSGGVAGTGTAGAGAGQDGGERGGGPNAPGGFGGGGKRAPGIHGDGGFGGGGDIMSVNPRPPRRGDTASAGGHPVAPQYTGAAGGFGAGDGGRITNSEHQHYGSGGDGMGGAIFNNSGSVVLRNATLVGNSAVAGSGEHNGDGVGGALYNYSGIVTLEGVTTAGNTAARSPGIYSLADGACRRGGNTACTNGDDALLQIDRSLVESLHMSRTGTGAGDSAATGGGNLLQTSPALSEGASIAGFGFDVVADFSLDSLPANRRGGFADIRIPTGGSPAIDASGACTGEDQRRVNRPQGPACDAGAVELALPRPNGCFVRASAPGGGNGGSWASAYRNLQQALLDGTCGTIRVAAGVYRPAASADRHATFRITRSLTLLGGFPAAGGSDAARDPDAHASILSGDVDNNDPNDDGNFINEDYSQTTGSNSFHVVTVEADGHDVILDGVVVTAGRASTNSGNLGRGAGILALGGELQLKQLRMSGQRAYHGAALYLAAGTAELVDSVVSGNYTIKEGGSVYLAGGTTAKIHGSVLADNLSYTQGGAVYAHTGSSLEVSDSELRGNRADSSGGALYSRSSLGVLRSLFHGNSSGGNGGAISNAGALEVAHSTFSGNDAVNGGAILTGSNTSLSLVHATVYANRSSSTSAAGGLHLSAGADVDIRASVVLGSTRGRDCIDHEPATGNVVVIDSLIGLGNRDCVSTLLGVPWLAPLQDHGGPSRVHMPGPGSVLLDRTACLSGAPHGKDQRGIDRPQGGTCDIGAVEARHRMLAVSIDGQGSVAAERPPIGAGLVSCNGSCSWPWPEAGSVQLTASADTGWQFDGWGGDCSAAGAAPEATVAMSANRSCSAGFIPMEYTLAYAAGSNGSLSGPVLQTVVHGADGAAVTAQPDTGYRFAQWSDGASGNPRIDHAVTSGLSVTALFVPDAEYSLSYMAGPNGSLSGAASQTVAHGDDGSPVTAVADAGHHFDAWSDGRSDNPRTDTGVTADLAVGARFLADVYALNYGAGANGSLAGDTAQQVAHGGSGTPVEAVPDVGYRFVQWSDGRSDNPRADSAVTGPLDVFASFALRQYQLDYSVSGNGSLLGNASQLVSHGGDGTPVEAVADAGHVFEQWSDGSSDNPRTDTAVVADASFAAIFVPRVYTLQYGAGTGGSIQGEHLQDVSHGEDASSVTALPEPGYRFVGWSDSRSDNPRVDTGVTADLQVEAAFEAGSYTLSLAVAPSAAGTLSVLEGDPTALPFNGTVLLGASPAPGWDLAPVNSFPPVLACTYGNRSLSVQEVGGLLTVDSGPITDDCTLTVYFANQPPGFVAGPAREAALLGDDEVVREWATGVRADRDGNASGQALAFVLEPVSVEPAGANLFAAGGAPLIDGNGWLRFTPGAETGTAAYSVWLEDDAGSDYGGSDSTAPLRLEIQLGTEYVGLSLTAIVPATLNFPGDRVAFTLALGNAGPGDAASAVVAWTPPMDLADVAWTCQPHGAATCTITEGAGAISVPQDLAVGEHLDYLVQATLLPGAAAVVESLATVTATTGQADSDPTDDITQVVLRVDGLFRDGMEAQP